MNKNFYFQNNNLLLSWRQVAFKVFIPFRIKVCALRFHRIASGHSYAAAAQELYFLYNENGE